jgi:long-chain acyl-CoA synthetase
MAIDTKSEQRPRAVLEANTLCEAFQITAADNPDRPALRTKGDAFSCSWSEYADRVRSVAAGLAALGVGRGDTVALMLTNRPEFHFADTGAMHLGATPFSIYNTYSPEQIEFLVGDAKNRVAITEQAFLDRVLEAQKACDTLEHVVVVDGEARDGAMTLEELMSKGEDGFDFEAAWKAVEPDDILTLIYTSGTTGMPKGVQLTHSNLVECVRSYDQIIQFPSEGRIVSYLPMAHVAERNVSQYLPMMLGFTVTCCPNPREVIAYLPEVKPSWFFAVPRIFEKLKSAIEAGMAAEPDEKKKQGMQWAMDVGYRKVRAEQAGEEIPEELRQEYAKADELVFSKIRENLGLTELESRAR